MNKKTAISSSIALALGFASLSANAALTSSAVMVFDEGVPGCVIGGVYPDCVYGLTTVTSGSWFSMDTNGNGVVEPTEKVAIFKDLTGGATDSTHGLGFGMHDLTPASGSHAGPIDGTETTVGTIWEFFGGTGMNYLTSPMTADANNVIDMSGWTVGWNGITAIPMGGDTANFAGDTGAAQLNCSTASCSASSTFSLDYAAHVPLGDASGFGGVGYDLHLEGVIGTNLAHVPVPAAVWLFGSGLLGLVGVARRKKA